MNASSHGLLYVRANSFLVIEIAAPSRISGGKSGSAAPSGICAEYSATSGNKKNNGSQVGARRMDSNVVNSE